MSMSLREAGYRWEIPQGRVLPFEEKILASGLCDFALDMTFSSYRGSRRARYDCAGFVSLGEVDLKDNELLMEILEKTLLALVKAGEFFIDREKILLKRETVFYNRESGEVKLAYYPREEVRPLQESILAYMEELGRACGETGRHCLGRLGRLFYEHNSSLSEMLRAIGQLRREMEKREESEEADR